MELHKVTDEELPALKQWLDPHMPQSWKICCAVREKLSGKWSGLTFYTLGWPDIRAVAEGMPDETCLVTEYYTKPLRTTSVYSPSIEDAQTLLTFPGFIDWTKPLMLQCLDHRLSDMVVSLCKKFADDNEEPLQFSNYLMVAEKGTLTKSPDCPEGMTVRDLDFEKDGEFAFENWPHKRPTADTYMKALVESYRSVAVFDKEGKCLGYEMSTEYGTMGMLFVSSECRGKGLGSFVTCKMAEHKFNEGVPAAVTVIKVNEPSVKLHERLGFKTLCDMNWIIHNRKLAEGV